MAVQIHFDTAGVPLLPHLILATRSGHLIREIPANETKFMETLVSGSEFSFAVYRENCLDKDGNIDEAFWKQVTDFKLAYCKDFDRWYELKVDMTESTETVKSVIATSLGEAELSQTNVYGIEINTETDIERDDYEPTVLYSAGHPEKSLIDRLLYKAPHYRVKHVDDSIRDIQRTFAFDGKTVYDCFSEVSQEIGCLFLYDCTAKEGGGVDRTISVYDLEYHCPVCGQRGEYMPVCTNCGNTTLPGYGTDTTVFVARENLAKEITYTTNTDAVKNCFRLEAGDDLMTAGIVACNPNGSQYIWYITDDMKADMTSELQDKLADYDDLYEYYQSESSYSPPSGLLDDYNDIVEKYQNTWRPDISLAEKQMPASIVGYPALMKNYFDTIDIQMFLESEMMPSSQTSTTDAETEAAKLTSISLSPVAVANITSCTADTAASAVVGMAKCIVRGTYQVKATESSIGTVGQFLQWTGKLRVTNYGDEEDTAETGSITVVITNDLQKYIQQKIDRMINQTADDPTDISALFKLDIAPFTAELSKYCRTRLIAFRDACQAALDILIQQGVADAPSWVSEENDLYQTMYVPYLRKMSAIEDEIRTRSDEIGVVYGTVDNNGGILTDGMQTVLKKQVDTIRADLNFENYLGEELWQEFAGYRREDVYKNDNYISDGLSNYDLMIYAERFLNTARQEIFKSATMQHSIQASMANLLAMEEFQPLKQKFRVGNWIRVRADGDVYRLRLSEYTIDYSTWNLDVVFTDLKQGYSAASDLQSMLSAVKSMQTTYGSVTRQAKDGEKGLGMLDRWVNEGLALTTNIVGGAENQEFTMDESGFTGKELIPETGEYSPEQVKIISHGVYMTDDGWVTAKAALGRFRFLNPQNNFREEEAFGVIADKLVGNLVLSQSIGIYNSDGSLTMDENGFTLITEHTGNQKVFNIKRRKQDGTFDNIVSLDASGNLVLQAYSTTGEMNTAIGVSANGVKTYVSDNYSTKANTVKTVTVEYIVWDYGDDEHAPPNDDTHWSTDTPVWTSGKYIWQHTKTTNGTDTVSYSAPACIQGASGLAGYNSAVVYLYQRATSTPSAPSGTLTYTFSTGILSGTLGSWSQTIPSGDNPIYVIAATAASRADTDTIASNEWSSAVVLAQNGDPGTNGLNSATVRLYQRAASAPSKPSTALTYTFATGVLADIPTGWSQAIPASDGNPCWVTQATAVANTATDTIAASEWSTVSKLVEDGEPGQPGTDGYNTAVVYLYQRATSAPSAPSGTLTYTFSTGALSGSLGSWSQTIPTGTNPIYVIAATAASRTDTDTIASNEWSAAVVLAQNGTNGQPGTNGLNSATVRLYQRAASAPSKPSASLTYTFATGVLANIPTGWSQAIPASDGNPCWVTQATAVANTATDTIAASEWSTVSKLVEDGEPGENGIGISKVEPEYYLSTSDQTPTGGSWSPDQWGWEDGKYIWTRSKITWNDSTQAQPHIEYTDPVLAQALNNANEQAYNTNQTLTRDYSTTTQTKTLISSEVGRTSIQLVNGINLDSTNLAPYPMERYASSPNNNYKVTDNFNGSYTIEKLVTTSGTYLCLLYDGGSDAILQPGTYVVQLTEDVGAENDDNVSLSYYDTMTHTLSASGMLEGSRYIYQWTLTLTAAITKLSFIVGEDTAAKGYKRIWTVQINRGSTLLDWDTPVGAAKMYTTNNLCPWPMGASYSDWSLAPVFSSPDGSYTGEDVVCTAALDTVTLLKDAPGWDTGTYSVVLEETSDDQDFFEGNIKFYNGVSEATMAKTQETGTYTKAGSTNICPYPMEQAISGDDSSYLIPTNNGDGSYTFDIDLSSAGEDKDFYLRKNLTTPIAAGTYTFQLRIDGDDPYLFYFGYLTESASSVIYTTMTRENRGTALYYYKTVTFTDPVTYIEFNTYFSEGSTYYTTWFAQINIGSPSFTWEQPNGTQVEYIISQKYILWPTINASAAWIYFKKTMMNAGTFDFNWKISIVPGETVPEWEPPQAVGIQYSISSAYSQINQTAESIEMKVDKDGIISAINMSPETISIDASKVNISGFVTISDLSAEGTVEIYGGRIKGGTITLGGNNNGNGRLQIVNASSKDILTADNTAFTYYCRSSTSSFFIKDGSSTPNTLLEANQSGLKIYCRSTTAGLYLMDNSVTPQTIMEANSNGIALYKGSIQGPTIYVGGNENGDGAIYVRNSSDTTIVTLNNSGIYTSSTTINASGISTSSLTASSYINFDCSNQSYFKIPFYAGNGYMELSSSDGFSIYSYGDFITINNSGNFNTTGEAHIDGNIVCCNNNNTGITCNGYLEVDGYKNRVVRTRDFGARCLSAFESTTPMFMDAGTGTIDESGTIYIFFEDIFMETISYDTEYYVFIQNYGNGECWVSDRKPGYFTVSGTPGLSFCWEIHAKQKEYDQDRLNRSARDTIEQVRQLINNDIDVQAAHFIEDYYKEIIS